jgi:hypothetical protein
VAVEKFEVWVDQAQDRHDEFAYRYIYSAYLAVHSGFGKSAGHATLKVLPEGGFVLEANGREELHLVDDAERKAFVAYLVARFCGDRHPNMAAWEAEQHEWFKDDRWWLNS